MLWKNRDQGRSFRIGFPVLYGLLILFTSCSGAPSRREAKANHIDPTLITHYEKAFNEYVEALLLLGSANPADRDEAGRRLEMISFTHFKDDRVLLRIYRTGSPSESELARKELARRGTMLDTIRVFTEPYSRVVWDSSRKKMISLGEDSRVYLVVSLLRLLINGTYRKVWPQLRDQLAECGGMALETTAELARQKADASPATPIWKQDDLVQLFMVILSFGNQGKPMLQKLATHENWNVRKAVAMAIGNSLSGEHLDQLETFLAGDRHWQVKAAAANALGRFRFLRDRVGKFLLQRIREEKDKFVLHKVILAVGRVHYTRGIPRLIQLLEHPDSDTIQVIMESLYDLTGERLTSPVGWQKWYRDDYAAWIEKQRNP